MEENKTQEKENPYMIAGSIIVAGFIIAGAVIYTNGSARPKTAVAPPNPAQGQAAAILTPEELVSDSPTLGNPQAPVTIVEFSDFQCPFCEKFFQTTEKQVMDKYVKTGQVKFVYRHYPFLDQKNYDPSSTDEESTWAALASECANEQGKFWEYHDYLFNHQGKENSGTFTKNNLKIFAGELGLDTRQFNNCLDTEKYIDRVMKDKNDADRAGITGTPTNFVNGIKIVGAVPFSQQEADASKQQYGLETLIQNALKNTK